MGKNHGKHGRKTAYAKMESVMAKLDNQLKREAASRKKDNKKERKNNE